MALIRVGIVGTGLSANQHVTALRQMPEASVVGVAGTSREKARAFAATWDIPAAFDSAPTLLAEGAIDVLHACVPPDARVELVRACAAHGVHILVEKPMARTLAEADAMIDIAAAGSITLGSMFQNRFTPLAQRTRQLVQAGDLGRVIIVELSARWYREAEYYRGSAWRGSREREGGAVLINQAIHGIDLLRWICGPVQELSARVATQVQPIEMEDTGIATLRFANGALGSIVATTAGWPGFSDRLEIQGTDGWARLIQAEGRLEWQRRGMREPVAEHAKSQVSGASRDPAATPSAGHVAAFRDLYSAIAAGTRPAL
ncbi:MAG: Gfo/Idh/MocA family oxidoreductase, partial [Chloroflexi bacterium]|nr:Gfo/Idh/MocA family oxidoreductase [Chloroflexota bacterium]